MKEKIDLPELSVKDEFIVRSIKVMDIGYIGVLYFLLAWFVIYISQRYFGEFDIEKERKKVICALPLKLWL